MRRVLYPILFLALIVIFLAGCSASLENDHQDNDPSPVTSQVSDNPTETGAPQLTDTVERESTSTPSRNTATPIMKNEPTESPPTATIIVEPVPTEPSQTTFRDLSISADDLFFFPVPELYDGDQVSIQVAPEIPRGLAPNDVDVKILLDDQELVTGILNWRKLSGDTVGLYQWVWDTDGAAGKHTITAILDPLDLIQIGDENPDNNQITIDVNIQSRPELLDEILPPRWITTTIPCCIVHTVSGTAAQRDLEDILPIVEEAFNQASRKLVEPLSGPYHIYFADRVFGQGGYTIDSMVVSYLDRDYVGGGFYELLAHEASHLIDQEFAPNNITFLSEGVAVWVAGGHYQHQELGQRMAALVEINRYIPLTEVINNFFSMQHEISYLEGASLIEYLVETYGWTAVRRFYSEATADDGPSLADAIDYNLRYYFGSSLEQVESDWLSYVGGLPRDREIREDLRTTLRYYDVMRRYQVAYDPTAYYLYAWLPAPELAEQREVTADFTRHPNSEINIALEAMLAAANRALVEGNFSQANALLESVDTVIDNDGSFLDPLARSYLNIVTTLLDLHYEIRAISVNGDRATATVSEAADQEITQLHLVVAGGQSWKVIP